MWYSFQLSLSFASQIIFARLKHHVVIFHEVKKNGPLQGTWSNVCCLESAVVSHLQTCPETVDIPAADVPLRCKSRMAGRKWPPFEWPSSSPEISCRGCPWLWIAYSVAPAWSPDVHGHATNCSASHSALPVRAVPRSLLFWATRPSRPESADVGRAPALQFSPPPSQIPRQLALPQLGAY